MECAECLHSKEVKGVLRCKKGGPGASRGGLPWAQEELDENFAPNCPKFEFGVSRKLDSFEEKELWSLENWSKKSKPTWVTAGGRETLMREMTDSHLSNTINMLARNGDTCSEQYHNLVKEKRRRTLVNTERERRDNMATLPKKRKGSGNFIDNFVKQVEDVVFDFQSSRMGIRTDEGIFTYDVESGESTINPIDFFSSEIPAYAIRTPLSELKIGDIVMPYRNRYGFVVEISEDKKRARCIYASGICGWIRPPKNLAFGGCAVMCVKNIFGSDQMNPMMLFAMSGDSEMDPSKMAMMMMAQGNQGGQMGMASMLPMLMMGKEDVDAKDLMMMSMFQGGQGIFPMAVAEEPKKKPTEEDDD